MDFSHYTPLFHELLGSMTGLSFGAEFTLYCAKIRPMAINPKGGVDD
jgi:hypothetical protein